MAIPLMRIVQASFSGCWPESECIVIYQPHAVSGSLADRWVYVLADLPHPISRWCGVLERMFVYYNGMVRCARGWWRSVMAAT